MVRVKGSETEDNMATMALPICELGPVIVEAEKAQADTKCVVSASGAQVASLTALCHVVTKTLRLRYRFARLVDRQSALLGDLTERDFSSCSIGYMTNLAAKIEDLVNHERDLLDNAYTLGVPIRVWWGSSLAKMTEQVEHFDSISESLRVATDPEGTALLAMAVEEFSSAREFALQ
jgi:hypothetical protein